MRKSILSAMSAAASITVLSAAAVAATSKLPYQDPARSVTERTEDLLKRMTLEEKLAQLQSVWHQRRQMEDAKLKFIPEKAASLMPHGIGHIARPSEFKTPQQTAEFNNAAQRWLREHTRLGIPALMHEEALHGYVAFDATSFPQAMALASSWSADDVQEMYSVAAREMRATGAHWALAPVLDIARDPRWGRIEETMGEDPYLVATLGIAAIRGLQGEPTPEHGWDQRFANDKVVATLKHLTGHGQPQAGVNTAPAHIAPRELAEVFLTPFEAAVKLAHAASIMPSYNEVDGLPSHINQPLLRDIVRKQWGFQGAVVSDYFAIQELRSRHQLYANDAEAAKAALLAGVDMETPDPKAYPLLAEQVKSGALDIAVIDDAVRAVLRLKFRLGLFEQQEVVVAEADQTLGSTKSRQLAQSIAEKSIVLLKNDATLPLDASKIRHLAVIGPHADETLLGGYSSIPRQTVNVLQGLQQKLKGKAKVSFARGARITENSFLQTKSAATADSTDTSSTNALQAAAAKAIQQRSQHAGTYSMLRWNHDDTVAADPLENARLRAEAVALAKTADAVVLVLGENEGLAREAWADKHLGDRTTLELSADQQLLAAQVQAAAGDKPVVLVLSNGRPLTLGSLASQMPAIVEAWYLGQETGTALANILFGDVNPSGKLPLTFPRSAGHIPSFYNHKASSSRGYLHDDISPLYPFGHGLSYTEFSYSDLSISTPDVAAGAEALIKFQLKNSGKRAGTEVVQLYVQDPVASLTRPVQQLVGFARVSLEPGQTARVKFALPVNQLAFLDSQMRWVVEPGEIRVMIGSSSADLRLRGVFNIAGAVTDVSAARALQSRVNVSYGSP
ncbi:glycoside hydrolase family 3 N-terminal domain-containing protein [Rheinheimera tilapiae]|uniref:Glycoside hydrolase family 3 N-terminal domain-containing protein n=1 Tax=Rheinheimera tilapiae TaxID=875043 RepID=A0ABV6B8T4_9GAMM